MYILKIRFNIGIFAYMVMAIKKAIITPNNIANRDNFRVTELYFSMMGISLNMNLISNVKTITYSSDTVVSILNHFSDKFPKGPSSLIDFNAPETSFESFSPSLSFLNGYAFIS